MRSTLSGWSVILAWTTACGGGGGGRTQRPTVSLAREPFGTTTRGEAEAVYTLKNAHGLELRVIDYGGIILSLKVPDRNGAFDDVVLGYDSLAGYLRSSPYFGAIIGRYGHRIGGRPIPPGRKTHTPAQNNRPH